MRIDFVTLFPEMVLDAVSHSIMGRAAASGLLEPRAVNPRDFTHDPHRTVDSRPFGGGPGMVLMAQPIADALESVLSESQPQAVILCDPAGTPFRQSHATQMATLSHIVFVCGHYEGVDERVRNQLCTHAFSVSDFVVTGGELPALMMADAMVRLIPGVLGDPESHQDDSFQTGLLGHPLYTQPREFRGEPVPEVLLSGDHGRIERWRRQQALRRTRAVRPDLFARAGLTSSDLELL